MTIFQEHKEQRTENADLKPIEFDRFSNKAEAFNMVNLNAVFIQIAIQQMKVFQEFGHRKLLKVNYNE